MTVKINESITQDIIKKYCKYYPESGVLLWKKRNIEDFSHCKDPIGYCATWNTRWAGKEVGAIGRNGINKYLTTSLTVYSKRYNCKVHRLIWLYMTGEMPTTIDHDDGNGLNNKWSNLKNTSPIGNSQNSRMHKNNTSGFNGVCWSKACNKWMARIKVNRKAIHGGVFTELEDAIRCRKQLNIDYGFHELHGQIKLGRVEYEN